MVDRVTSLDNGYVTGDLSLYPDALDDKESLYDVRNNAITTLKQTLPYSGQTLIVESTAAFPDKGILRIGPPPGDPSPAEMIYYDKKTTGTFQTLIRGFAGSRASQWAVGANVTNAVFAEIHNSIKDAIVNIENNWGLLERPDSTSLNGILKAQEVRFLAPKPLFRVYPLKGPPPLKVRFQNFTTGHIARYLWNFGDGGTSLETNPTHTYLSEGVYTVKLNVVTTAGAQGIVTKKDYITVSNDESPPFFYVASTDDPYSVETATEMATDPKEFVFVDQTDGDVVQRNWVFGDGQKTTIEDPDIHEIKHTYNSPGEYVVTELIQFSDGRIKRAELQEPLVVL